MNLRFLIALMLLIGLQLQAQDLRVSGLLSGSQNDRVSKVLAVNPNRLLLVGETNSIGNGSYLAQATMVDTLGHVIWSHAYGDLGDDRLFDAVMASDSGFFLFGYSNSVGAGAVDLILIRINKMGTLQWGKAFGGSGSEYARNIVLLPSGDLLLNYSTTSYGSGGPDFAVSRISKLGDHQWTKTWGGADMDSPQAMTRSGNQVVLVGNTRSYGQGLDDIMVIAFDTSGATSWWNVLGTTGFETANQVALGPDGMIYLGAYSYGSDDDLLAVKLDQQGRLLHANMLTWSGNNYAAEMQITSDYRIFFGAQLQNPWTQQSKDYALIEYDTTCAPIEAHLMGQNGTEVFQSMYWLGSNASFLLYGYTDGFGNGDDILWYHTKADGASACDNTYYGLLTPQPVNLIATQPWIGTNSPTPTTTSWNLTTSPITWADTILCTLVGIAPTRETITLEVSPNPASDFVRASWNLTSDSPVRLALWDLNGRLQLQENIWDGASTAILDVAELPAGVYLLEWHNGDAVQRTRILVAR